jgi:four helix bundle protein
MATEDFTRMAIWQKSQDLAAEIVRLVSQLPRDRAAEVIGTQLLRAAGSVPANIAEGYGRFSQAAYRNHLSIARGSLFEVQSWIDLLHRSGFISEEVKSRLLEDCISLGKMLTIRMKSLSVREESATYEV